MLQQLAVGLMYDRFISFAGTLESLPGGSSGSLSGKENSLFKGWKNDRRLLNAANCRLQCQCFWLFKNCKSFIIDFNGDLAKGGSIIPRNIVFIILCCWWHNRLEMVFTDG